MGLELIYLYDQGSGRCGTTSVRISPWLIAELQPRMQSSLTIPGPLRYIAKNNMDKATFDPTGSILALISRSTFAASLCFQIPLHAGSAEPVLYGSRKHLRREFVNIFGMV